MTAAAPTVNATTKPTSRRRRDATRNARSRGRPRLNHRRDGGGGGTESASPMSATSGGIHTAGTGGSAAAASRGTSLPLPSNGSSESVVIALLLPQWL